MQDDLEQIVSDGPFSDVSVYSELESRQGFSEFIIVVMIDQPILSYFVFGDVKVIVQVRPNTDPVVRVRPDANYILQETHIMQWSRDCKHVRNSNAIDCALFSD